MSAYLDVSGLADENSRIVARRKRAEQKLERDKEEVPGFIQGKYFCRWIH